MDNINLQELINEQLTSAKELLRSAIGNTSINAIDSAVDSIVLAAVLQTALHNKEKSIEPRKVSNEKNVIESTDVPLFNRPQTTDSGEWATAFCKNNVASDHEVMRRWFFDAIVAGISSGYESARLDISKAESLGSKESSKVNFELSEINRLREAIDRISKGPSDPTYMRKVAIQALSRNIN